MGLNTNTFKISAIIPCFNEENNIEAVSEALANVLKEYHSYEIILIDDGSTDKTLDKFKKISKANIHIKYLSFSRNFGHQNALKAGMDHATGDCAISMDADLQHPTSMINSLIAKWKEGYDIVYTMRKEDPGLPTFKRLTSKIFYKILNGISDITIQQGTADFRLLDRKVLNVFKTINENPLFIRGMVSWLGFKQHGIPYTAAQRLSGDSKYTFHKMLRLASEGVTSFSIRPLHFTTFLGLFIAVASFGYGLFSILAKIFTNKVVSGWTSVITSIVFMGGIQLIMLGIIGEYLGKLFLESKKRPSYIVNESNL